MTVPDRITRRQFLGGTAATAAAAVLGSCARSNEFPIGISCPERGALAERDALAEPQR
jgi:hypothetical protein